MKDLVGAAMNMPSDDDHSPAAQAARAAASMMSVIAPYADRKSGDGTRVEALDDKALRDMVLKTSQEMIAVQDAVMARDAETRRAMHDAVADGSYDDRIKLAEKKEEEDTGVKKSPAEREKERLSGAKNAQKIQVAKQMVKEKSESQSGESLKGGKGNSGSGNAAGSSGDMAQRIAARNARAFSNSSGASRAVVGSDISGLVKDAAEQLRKAESEIEKNKRVVEATISSQTAAREKAEKEQKEKEQKEKEEKEKKEKEKKEKEKEQAKTEGGGGGVSNSWQTTQPSNTCASYTKDRCEKALICNLDSLKCRAAKSAQAAYCVECLDFVGDYMTSLANSSPDSVGSYATMLGGHTWSSKANFQKVDRATRKAPVRVCKKEIVPCTSKTFTGQPCGSLKYQQQNVCYDVYDSN
jgi:hypothetical protein